MGVRTHERARTIIEEAIASLPGIDLESIDIAKAGRRDLVRVVVDRDGGIDLDAVADVSRAVAEALDAPESADVFPGAYVLEVTSPGVDRPLTEPKHWRRSLHRLVRVQRAAGDEVEGRIVAVDETGATLALAGAGQTLLVPFADVAKAIVQVEFNPEGQEVPSDLEEGEA